MHKKSMAKRKNKAQVKKSQKRQRESELTVKAGSLLFGSAGVGISLNEETVKNMSAVFCAVQMITTSVAKLPLLLYKKNSNGGRERATEHPLFNLFYRKPSKRLSPFALKEMMTGHMLMAGDFISQVVSDNAGRVSHVIPLNPHQVEVRWKKDAQGSLVDQLEYLYTNQSRNRMIFREDQVLHVRGLGDDGFRGKSVFGYARNSLQRVAAMDQHASDFFSNGASPSGLLKHPLALSSEAAERLRKDFKDRHTGVGKSHDVLLLEEGMSWEQIGVNPQDAQLLQSRQFEIEEIARWFNIQPHKLKHLLYAKFSNIEHQNQEFWDDTIMPLTKRMQDALNLYFFGEDASYFFEFLYDSLLITDTKTRYEAHNIAVMGGWKRRNEVRMIENLNPEDGLNDFLEPLNMAPAGSRAPNKQAPADSEDPQDDSKVLNSFRDVSFSLFSRAIRRQGKSTKLSAEDLKSQLKRDVEPLVRSMLSCLTLVRQTEVEIGVLDASIAGVVEEFSCGWAQRSSLQKIEEDRLPEEFSTICSIVKSRSLNLKVV